MGTPLRKVLHVEVGRGRKLGEIGRDAIGQEHRGFHERARAGYLRLAAADPQRWVVLNGALDPEHIAAQIWAIIAPLLPAR